MAELLPLSVVIPTLGRPSLHACLASVAACDPGPAEILVVDQSGNPDSARSVGELLDDRGRFVVCAGRGVARATNRGLREAKHSLVLITHDDCTVARDWVAAAWCHMADEPAGIVTGRVLPSGDPGAVPSCKTDVRPQDFTGQPHYGALYPNNMVMPKLEVLAVGGFDERPSLLVSEDLDFCYRWSKAGRPLRYRADMTVWHHDWRTPEQLVDAYVGYGRGQGAFFAKHLYAGDRRMLGYLARTVAVGVRGTVGAVVHRRPRWSDERLGILPGLPGGFLAGWREARLLDGPRPRSRT